MRAGISTVLKPTVLPVYSRNSVTSRIAADDTTTGGGGTAGADGAFAHAAMTTDERSASAPARRLAQWARHTKVKC